LDTSLSRQSIALVPVDNQKQENITPDIH